MLSIMGYGEKMKISYNEFFEKCEKKIYSVMDDVSIDYPIEYLNNEKRKKQND